MTKLYQKPALKYDQQLQLLKGRGMLFKDISLAHNYLSTVGYYRLSGYWYIFRKKQDANILDEFKPDTYFEEVIKLYEFDRKLRLLVLNGLERTEVTVRTRMTYYLGLDEGAFCYSSKDIFHDNFNLKSWIKSTTEEVERASDEFIMHFKIKYQDFPKIPIWMLTEVLSLGALSRMYKGLKHKHKQEISSQFNVHFKEFEKWMHTFTYVRNVCAHHSRLWSRELAIHPKKSKLKEWSYPITPRNDRIFYILLMAISEFLNEQPPFMQIVSGLTRFFHVQ